MKLAYEPMQNNRQRINTKTASEVGVHVTEA